MNSFLTKSQNGGVTGRGRHNYRTLETEQKSRFNTDVSFKKHKAGRAGARNTKPQPQSKSTLRLRKDVTKTKEN